MRLRLQRESHSSAAVVVVGVVVGHPGEWVDRWMAEQFQFYCPIRFNLMKYFPRERT